MDGKENNIRKKIGEIKKRRIQYHGGMKNAEQWQKKELENLKTTKKV